MTVHPIKSEHSKDKLITIVVPMHPVVRGSAKTKFSDNKKANEKKDSAQFNTEGIFKARKYELF